MSILVLIIIFALSNGCKPAQYEHEAIVIKCDTIGAVSPIDLEQSWHVICFSEKFIEHKHYHGDPWILDSITYTKIDPETKDTIR